MTDRARQEGEPIVRRTADHAVRVAVLHDSETFWFDRRRMAELVGVDVRNWLADGRYQTFRMCHDREFENDCDAEMERVASPRPRTTKDVR